MEYHMRRHLDQMRSKCRHLLVHPMDKSYQCLYCRKTFPKKSDLDNQNQKNILQTQAISNENIESSITIDDLPPVLGDADDDKETESAQEEMSLPPSLITENEHKNEDRCHDEVVVKSGQADIDHQDDGAANTDSSKKRKKKRKKIKHICPYEFCSKIFKRSIQERDHLLVRMQDVPNGFLRMGI